MNPVPPYSQDPQSVRVTDQEVVAMTELHQRLRDGRTPTATLKDVAEMLGISEYEARALLAQVRNEQTPPEPTAFATFAAPKRRSLASVLPFAAVGAVLLIAFLMFFSFRAGEPTVTATQPATAETVGATTGVAETATAAPMEVAKAGSAPEVVKAGPGPSEGAAAAGY